MKVDTTKIAGYADMTPEEKVAALEALEMQDNEEDRAKLKAAVDKATNEAATFKKKWQDTLNEQEREKVKKEEELNALRAENAEYKKRERVSNYTAKFMAVGYDEATAKELAADSPEGLTDGFFEKQKTFYQNAQQQMKVANMNNAPKPTPGMPVGQSYLNDETQLKLRKAMGLK